MTEKRSQSVTKEPQPSKMNNLRGLLGTLVIVVLMATYTAYTLDPDKFSKYSSKYPLFLRPLEKSFELIDKYSPFHNAFDEPSDVPESTSNKKELVMTKMELSLYDGSESSPGLYLAVLGHVFDVGNNRDMYGPGGGYHFFTGKDGSRAFVTGEFNAKGLTDDIEGLSSLDYKGLEEWLAFYKSDYKYVGKLEGYFFDASGNAKPTVAKFEENVALAHKKREALEAERRLYPPCNTQTSAKLGKRVWCTKRSGGIERNWVGVPRRLFIVNKKERCACIRTTGPPSNDAQAQSNTGDLDSPLIKEYEGCDPKASECTLEEPEEAGKKSKQ